MSTKTRESCPPKRGSSPSASNGGGKRSPGPSKTTSPDERNIPGYLRPTASSSNKPTVSRRRSFDNKPPSPSRSDKSPVSLRSSSFSGKTGSDSADNPAQLRRRSLDKPPSPSRTQRSPVASQKTTLRSSSFSGRTGGVQKAVSERNLKGLKDAGKQHTLYARPVSTGNKSNVLAKKQPGSDSSRKEREANPPEKVGNPNTHDVPESEPEPEPQSDDPESSIAGNCNEQGVEDSVLEDQGLTNVVEQSEGESHDKDGSAIESPTVLEQDDANVEVDESHINSENQDDKNETVEPPCMVLEDKEASGDVNAEEIEDESRAEEIQEQTTTETNETDSDERVADNPNEEMKDEERKEEEEIALSEKEEVAENGSESHESKETEMDVEEKTGDENATPREAHGKKDLALSNDVIEETRIKLVEQRQNKVKALAGAFQTVISQHDPK